MQNVTLNVQGMSCGHCVNAVAFDDAQVSLDQIKETIDDQGYEVK